MNHYSRMSEDIDYQNSLSQPGSSEKWVGKNTARN